MNLDICGVGTLAADVLMTVDALPGKDSFCMVTHSESQPGGSGTNAVVQAARLGCRSAYIGAVGDDEPGKVVRDSLKEEGIGTDYMEVRKGGVTTHTEVVVDQKGNKFILLIMGDAFFSLALSDKAKEAIAGAKVFFTDLLPHRAAQEGIRLAREKGVKTAVSLQLGMSLMEELGAPRKEVLGALQYADLLLPSGDAVRDIAGTNDPYEAVKAFRNYTAGDIVFTRGEKGAVTFARDGSMYETAAVKVDVKDTTGAGDSFLGALMAAYLVKGKSLKEALSFASSCAALTCTGLGARFRPKEGYPAL